LTWLEDKHGFYRVPIEALILLYSVSVTAVLVVSQSPFASIATSLISPLIVAAQLLWAPFSAQISRTVVLVLIASALCLSSFTPELLNIHFCLFAAIAGMSLALKPLILLVGTILVLVHATYQEGLNGIFVFALMALAGATNYLRHLIAYLDNKLRVARDLDIHERCKNISALHRDCEHGFALYERYQIPSTLLILDITYRNPKGVNDYKKTISAIVNVWLSRLRGTDYLYRVDNKRFVCLLSATQASQVKSLAHDLVNATLAYDLPDSVSIELNTHIKGCDEYSDASSWTSVLYD